MHWNDFLNEFGFGFNNEESFSNYPSDGDPNFKKTVKTTEEGNYLLVEERWVSLDGNITYLKVYLENKETFGQNVDYLKNKLEIAVDEEDYETAAQLRDKINEIEEK